MIVAPPRCGISFAAHYDSNPAPGVLPTDTELRNAITLTL
jgi:hypothetical protein